MSRTRIHNLSISLDGFATGEPQSAEAPFGHAGHRLHEWMFGTRFWTLEGASGDAVEAGGSAGVGHADAGIELSNPAARARHGVTEGAAGAARAEE